MRYPVVAALAFALSGCIARPTPDTFPVHRYVGRKVGEEQQEKTYASLYPHALAPVARETVRLRNPSVAQGALLTIVDIEWNGTLDDLVKTIAQKAGYRTRAVGERPGAPITVSINWRRISLIGALREGFKDGKGLARLEIDQSRRLMIVHYARPERSPVPHPDDTTL